MRNGQTRLQQAMMIGALFGAQATNATLSAADTNAAGPPTITAADTNTVEIIRQLQRRIEGLEQKVRMLEQGKAPGEETSDAKAKQQLEELGQKVTTLERDKEQEQEANAAKAKEAPRPVHNAALSFPNSRPDRILVQTNSRR